MIFDAAILALFMSPAGICAYVALYRLAEESLRRACEAAVSFDPVPFFREVA